MIDQRSQAFDLNMRQRLAGYLHNRKRTGDIRLYFKALLLFLSLILILFLLSTDILSKPLYYFSSVILGIVVAGIGFNVMHDAVHRSFSSKKMWNTFFSYSLNLLGGYWPIWEAQHNADHHMNTNINGLDGDLDFGKFARLHPSQKRYWWHRYQHIYMPLLLYPLSHLGWVYLLDFIKAKNLGYKFTDYLKMIFSKLIHVAIFIGLPLTHHDFTTVIIGYIITTMVTGVIISFVFQLAHVVEKTEMLDASENGTVRRDIVHQLRTTANFAKRSGLLTWYIGGLNFQVEHHLYYYVSHVHYPAISKMVEEECVKLNLPYHNYEKLGGAIWSHILKMRELGKETKKN